MAPLTVKPCVLAHSFQPNEMLEGNQAKGVWPSAGYSKYPKIDQNRTKYDAVKKKATEIKLDCREEHPGGKKSPMHILEEVE